MTEITLDDALSLANGAKKAMAEGYESRYPQLICAVEAQLTLAETEMLNAKAWSVGTQAKRHIDFAMTAICCARALLSCSCK